MAKCMKSRDGTVIRVSNSEAEKLIATKGGWVFATKSDFKRWMGKQISGTETEEAADEATQDQDELAKVQQ